MTHPSPNARHVRIGSAYQPRSFEHRQSDGTFASFMRIPNAHCERVQSALIGAPRQRSSWFPAIALAAAVIGAAVYLKGTV